MGEIPEDIFRVAADVWATLPNESAGIIAIARAILSERERCAKIAEDNSPVFQDMEFEPLQSLCNRIANTIRGGN
jgi:hypothetical protein